MQRTTTPLINRLLRITGLLFLIKSLGFFLSYRYLFAQFGASENFWIWFKFGQSEAMILGFVLLLIYLIFKVKKVGGQILLWIGLSGLYLLYFLDILALVIYQQRFSFAAIQGFFANFDLVVGIYILGVGILIGIMITLSILLSKLIKGRFNPNIILFLGFAALIVYALPSRELDFGVLAISEKNILQLIFQQPKPLVLETTTSNFTPNPKVKLDLPEKKLQMLESAHQYWKETAIKEPSYVFKTMESFQDLTDVYGENYTLEILSLAAQSKPEFAFSYLDRYQNWKDPKGNEIVLEVLSAAVQKNPDLAFQQLKTYEHLTQNGKKIAKTILQRASLAYQNKRNYADFFVQEEGRSNQANLILVFLESASSVDSQKFGGISERFSKIDQIADQGTSFLNLYANGSASDMGHIATLLGVEPLLHESDSKSYHAYHTPTLPLAHFFNNLGYHSTFISTASLDFLNQRDFIKKVGYQTIIDEKAFEAEKKYTFNAAADEKLYQKTLATIDQQQSPYFITLQTISSHTPYLTPYGNSETKMLEYINDSFADFYKGLKQRSFFENGILLVLSDHRKITPLSDAEFQKRGMAASSKIIGFMIGTGIAAKEDENFYQQHDIFYALKKEFGSGSVELWDQYNDPFSSQVQRNRGLKRFYNEDKAQVLSKDGYLGYIDLKEQKIMEGYAMMPAQSILEYLEQFFEFQKGGDKAANSQITPEDPTSILLQKKAELLEKKYDQAPQIIAHRGDMSTASENSLNAFLSAQSKGARGTELDITITKDGEVVVFHGHKLYNNTQCKNEQRSVCQLTLAELKACKLEDGQEILTLDEMLPEIKNLFDIYFFDLKIQDGEVCGRVNNDLFNKTMSYIIKYNLKNKSVFSSYDGQLSKALATVTTIPTGLDTFDKEDKALLIGSEFDYFIILSDHIDTALVQEIHDQGRKIVAYTVNTVEEFLRLAELGVDYVMTDEISLLNKTIERM